MICKSIAYTCDFLFFLFRETVKSDVQVTEKFIYVRLGEGSVDQVT